MNSEGEEIILSASIIIGKHRRKVEVIKKEFNALNFFGQNEFLFG